MRLLEYQLQELDNLNLGEDEYEKLILEHKQLSSAEETKTISTRLLIFTITNVKIVLFLN